jgi:hypothetical protein
MEALDRLLEIITTGVADIKHAYTTAGRAFPSLDEPYSGSDALEMMTAATTTLVVAAAQQLIAAVRMPSQTLAEAGGAVGVCGTSRIQS